MNVLVEHPEVRGAPVLLSSSATEDGDFAEVMKDPTGLRQRRPHFYQSTQSSTDGFIALVSAIFIYLVHLSAYY